MVNAEHENVVAGFAPQHLHAEERTLQQIKGLAKDLRHQLLQGLRFGFGRREFAKTLRSADGGADQLQRAVFAGEKRRAQHFLSQKTKK